MAFLNVFARIFWFSGSIVSSVLLVIGLMLPIIPQLPFLLATLFCLFKASPRFERWFKSRQMYLKYEPRLVQFLDKFIPKRFQSEKKEA